MRSMFHVKQCQADATAMCHMKQSQADAATMFHVKRARQLDAFDVSRETSEPRTDFWLNGKDEA